MMMAIERKSGNQLGSKAKMLFELMNNISDWELYVNEKTAEIVKKLYETRSMTITGNYFNMKYITVRSHILKAIERISSKRVDFNRNGQSPLAQKLFILMDSPDWKVKLTEHEIMLAEKFKESRNFYAVARDLNLLPGNIAATLYGSTQKLGVIGKIEKNMKK